MLEDNQQERKNEILKEILQLLITAKKEKESRQLRLAEIQELNLQVQASNSKIEYAFSQVERLLGDLEKLKQTG